MNTSMTANLVLRMTTTGDKSESESGIYLGKGLKVPMFWLQVFGDLGMTIKPMVIENYNNNYNISYFLYRENLFLQKFIFITFNDLIISTDLNIASSSFVLIDQ